MACCARLDLRTDCVEPLDACLPDALEVECDDMAVHAFARQDVFVLHKLMRQLRNGNVSPRSLGKYERAAVVQKVAENLAGNGFTLKQLLEFWWRFSQKGAMDLSSSTDDVVRKIVIPETKKAGKRAYVDVMAGGPQAPEVFVSHWYGGLFYHDVLCIVQNATRLQGQALKVLKDNYLGKGALDASVFERTYWMSTFSVDQHMTICGKQPSQNASLDWMDCVKGQASKIGICSCGFRVFPAGHPLAHVDKISMVLAKIQKLMVSVDPRLAVMTRLWCVNEIAMSVHANCDIGYYLPGVVESSLLHSGIDDTISVINCEAIDEDDKTRIFADIEHRGGVEAIDDTLRYAVLPKLQGLILVSAVEAQDLEAIRRLLRQGSGQLQLEPALLRAAQLGVLGAVSILVEAGADVDTCDVNEDVSSMVRLARNGDLEATWAIECQRRVAQTNTSRSGPTHRSTLISLGNLAKLYEQQMQQQKAEYLYRQIVEIRENTLGPNDPETLQSVDNLASALQNTGQYDEAEAIFRRAVDRSEWTLGFQHPDSLRRVSALARLKGQKGAFNEACSLYRRVLDVQTKLLGPEHPETMSIITNLACMLSQSDQFEEAERLCWTEVEVRHVTLGHQHPCTLRALSNLAKIVRHKGDANAAEMLCRRHLQGSEEAWGPTHPETLSSMDELAIILREKVEVDLEEVELLYRRTLQAREAAEGGAHPDTLKSLDNLADFMEVTGQFVEAEVLHYRSLSAKEASLGHASPEAVESVGKLGMVMKQLGQYAAAQKFMCRALESKELSLGRTHPDILGSLDCLASLMEQTGHYVEAESLYWRALEVKEANLGPEDPDTLDCLNDLGIVLTQQGQYEKAEEVFRRALETKAAISGPMHPDTLTYFDNLEMLYSCTLKVRVSSFGLQHPSTITSFNNLEMLLRRTLQVKDATLGRTHPDTVASYNKLCNLLKQRGSYGELALLRIMGRGTRRKRLKSCQCRTM